MLTVLSITFPIFAMVALGYGLVTARVFKPADMRVFGAFVMNLALPALIFNAVSRTPVSEVLNPAYLTAYAVAGLVMLALAFVWFSATTDPTRRGVSVMGVACPNSGFVGYPLLLVALPDIAGTVLAMNMLVEHVVVIPLALMAIEMGKPKGAAHPLARVGKVLLGVIRRPMVIALLLGLVATVIGVQIPAPADRLLEMIANAAAALSLLVIGGSLAGITLKGSRALASQIVLGKLILHPLVAVLVLAALGLTLPPDLRAAVILSAALPMFGVYTVFAQEAGHESLASIAQLGATTLSFVTLNVVLALLQL